MADTKISGFPTQATPLGTDEMVLNDPTDLSQAPSGTNKKSTRTQMVSYTIANAGFTTNFILFGGASGEITESSYIYFDDTNKRFSVGTGNVFLGTNNTVIGANTGQAQASYAIALGGDQPIAAGVNSVVLGGLLNITTGDNSAIAGGDHHQAIGLNTFVGGGQSSAAQGDYSIALGCRVNITHDGTFMFGDSTGGTKASGQSNSALFSVANGFGINAYTLDSSAIFQIDSTTHGALLPRMTTAQRNAIVSPADGLEIWNTSLERKNYYDSGGDTWWTDVVTAGLSTNRVPYAVGDSELRSSANFTFEPSNGRLIANSSTATIAGTLNTIISGTQNSITNAASAYSVIIGGNVNTISGGADNSVICGGSGQTISGTGTNQCIVGGYNNTTSAQFATAMGKGAQALHAGTVVIKATDDAGTFASTAADQFLVSAGAGIGLQTNAPNSGVTFGEDWSVKRTATAVNTNSGAETIIGVTTTAPGRTITLQTADTVAGRIYIIKDESGAAATDNITIATQGAQTIDGSASIAITANYGVLRVYSDGTNWYTF